MRARPKLTKRPDQNDAPKLVGQARPTEERLLLRVDGQTKQSFRTNRGRCDKKGLSRGDGHDCRY